MFYGRETELQVLEETYNKTGFQMTVIYGRRRIGKSELIRHFLKNKRSSYYTAAESSLEINVQKWSEQFIADLVPSAKGALFTDLDNFFEFVVNQCNNKRTVIALDEIPYIAQADSSFLSIFQRVIDTKLAKSNIYLIICGSAISFMEKEILSEKSPIFGRRSNQIFLKPFNYIEAARFVSKYTPEEKAIVYGVTGGVAKYLSLFDDNLSLDENIINNFFKTSGYLYEEPTNLLTQEFRSIANYNTVIEVCSGGVNKMNEIADKTHLSTAALSYILSGLMTTGIISKITAITEEKNKKKSKYEITDGMYRFWYKFIPSAKSTIEMNRGEKYYLKNVKPRLHEFMGSVFEQMCRYYTLLQGLDGNLHCDVTMTGTWWGNDHNHNQTDIDVVGLDMGAKQAVLGECKFKNEEIDKSVYDALVLRKGLIDHSFSEVQFLFFSLSGFSKWMLDKEKEDGDRIKLITLKEMYKKN